MLRRSYWLALLIFMAGCAGHSSFNEFHALTSESALDEIAARRRSLNHIETTMIIAFESPKGKVHLKCKATFDGRNHTILTLTGPLGVDLANIEILNNSYVMKNVQQSETLHGNLDEEIYFPALDLNLPALKYLVPMLIPYPNIIYPQEWSIVSADVVTDGVLRLKKTSGEDLESMNLKLDFSPLRIINEISNIKNSDPLNRTFSYDQNNPYLPVAVSINVGELLLNVNYTSIKFIKQSGSQLQVVPL